MIKFITDKNKVHLDKNLFDKQYQYIEKFKTQYLSKTKAVFIVLFNNITFKAFKLSFTSFLG